MPGRIFRWSLIAALLVWGVMLANLSWLELRYRQASHAALNPQIAPTATPIVVPTLAPVQPTPLNNALSIDPAKAEQQPQGAVHPKTGRYISAWLPTSFDADEASASFEANKDILDEVSPFWYGVAPNGDLVPEEGARDVELVERAHASNVLVIPTVHNVNDIDAATPIIADPAIRSRHVQVIVEEVERYNYDGIDIDFESLDPALQEEFTAFMIELGEELHSRGKLLTIAVHARTAESAGLADYQNYPQIGAVVDRFRIMTYDYHWRGGGPGPIAPLYWVEDVMEYALQHVEPSKIVVGVPFYGYNWGPGDDLALAQTWSNIEYLIEIHNPGVNTRDYDELGLVEEAWFVYNNRTVWFANPRSLAAKLDLVKRMDLAGIAIWRLGNEDPRNWEVIRENLVQDPISILRQVNTFLPEH